MTFQSSVLIKQYAITETYFIHGIFKLFLSRRPKDCKRQKNKTFCQKISDSQKQYQYNIYPKGPTLYSLNTEWGSKHLQLVYRIRVHKTLQLVYRIRVQNFTACLLNKGPKPFSLHTKSRSTVPPRGQHFIAFLQNNRVLFLKWAIFYTFTGYCSPKGPTFYTFHTEY